MFFSEWFHKDNNNQNTRIVIISSQDPDASLATFLTTSCVSPFFSPPFFSSSNAPSKKRAVRDSVVYIKGSPLDDKTLRARAKLHKSKVCFLILTDPSAAILTFVFPPLFDFILCSPFCSFFVYIYFLSSDMWLLSM